MNLTPRQFDALIVIDRHRVTTGEFAKLGHVADCLGMSKAAASDLVESLRKKGAVTGSGWALQVKRLPTGSSLKLPIFGDINTSNDAAMGGVE